MVRILSTRGEVVSELEQYMANNAETRLHGPHGFPRFELAGNHGQCILGAVSPSIHDSLLHGGKLVPGL